MSKNGGDESSGSICDGETCGEGMGVSSGAAMSVFVTDENIKKTAKQKKEQQTTHKKKKTKRKKFNRHTRHRDMGHENLEHESIAPKAEETNVTIRNNTNKKTRLI